MTDAYILIALGLLVFFAARACYLLHDIRHALVSLVLIGRGRDDRL